MSNAFEMINELVKKLEGTADDQQTLADIEYYCRARQREIDREFSSYFISVNDYGPDDDFVRIYTPLGFMTQEEARKRCNRLSDPDSYTAENTTMAVDEETYNLYLAWGYWHQILKDLDALKNFDATDIPWYNEVKEKVESIKASLGLKYRWIYPGLQR